MIANCSRCGAQHRGTITITVAAQPIRNLMLCRSCTAALRDWLATGPDEAERRRDVEREAAFRDGFDAGLAEPREAVAP